MMLKTLFLTLFCVFLIYISDIDGKKLSRSRSSSSGSRKTNSKPQPAPTSFSYPQPSAPKPSLFGWQEKPAPKSNGWQEKPVQKSQSIPRQSNPSNQGHSYPSSNTGLSGNNQPKQPPAYQETLQRSNAPVQQSVPQQQHNNQPSHSYPVSNGLSGGGNSGAGYPQGTRLSGSNVGQPSYPGANTANNYQPHGGGSYPNSFGTNYNHPQGPPPPYTSGANNYHHHPQGPPPPYNNFGNNYGGYGGHMPYSPQMPGYFGGYANSGKGFGGVSRTGSALTGVGIAGAGIGTVLTGLALWNLARSTGHHHHTVIYDNRGQPVAVAPDNSTAPAVDNILGDLVNCTLTISSENNTEVIAIPCSIATSFTPDADVKDVSTNNQTGDNTKCTVTVVTKAGKEYMTTIPCSILLNTAAENNVTEPPILDTALNAGNETIIANNTVTLDQPTALRLSDTEGIPVEKEPNLNCTEEPGAIRDPINSCFSVKHNLTVIPLQSTESQ